MLVNIQCKLFIDSGMINIVQLPPLKNEELPGVTHVWLDK